MPKYMLQANYTAEGVKGLIKETASGRRAAVKAGVKAVGGKLESMYYCFGKDDVVVIMDLPDNVAAARAEPKSLYPGFPMSGKLVSAISAKTSRWPNPIRMICV